MSSSGDLPSKRQIPGSLLHPSPSSNSRALSYSSSSQLLLHSSSFSTSTSSTTLPVSATSQTTSSPNFLQHSHSHSHSLMKQTSKSLSPSPDQQQQQQQQEPLIPHDNFENALNCYQQHETKENFRLLLFEVFSQGYAIDFEMKGGSTLLHHAVSLNLERETALILNSGARILRNNQHKTPIDVALERGNQVILQVLRRSSDYFNYLRSKNSSTSKVTRVVSSYQESTDQMISGVCKYGWSPTQWKHQNESSIWAPSFRFTDIYEDYLDWHDRKSIEMLQELVDNLRETEGKFQNELETAAKEKETSLLQIALFTKELKQKEHDYCMKIWDTVEYERVTRKLLEEVSLKLIDLKDRLHEAHKKVFFFGDGHMRYYNGFVVKTSQRVNIRVTGTSLQLGYVSHSQEKETSSASQKTRSRIIAIDAIDEIEISREVNSVSLGKKNDGRSPSLSHSRVSFTIRESNEQPTCGGKIYFIFRFRNSPSPPQSQSQSQSSSSSREEIDGDGKVVHLSPILGVPMRTPPPPHPIVLSLDDSWGEISTSLTQTPPEKVKEKSIFARAKAKLSGKKTSSSAADVATPSPPHGNSHGNFGGAAMTIYRPKSVAHEFFEALQSASMPDTHFYGAEYFLNRNKDESITDPLVDLPISSSPLIHTVREGNDWNNSSLNPAQISSSQGTSGLTSVESIFSSSQRTSSSYVTSGSSQSGLRISFIASERDSLQSTAGTAAAGTGGGAESFKYARSSSFSKGQMEIIDPSEQDLSKKSHSSSYQGPRSTLLLGRVAEEREDRSTSNDSSSLSHGSSQLQGLSIAPEHFHDCVRSHHREITQFPLVEDDEETQDQDQDKDADKDRDEDQEDWKSVGSDQSPNEDDCSRQYSLDSADKLVRITMDDEFVKEKPTPTTPSLLTLSLKAASSSSSARGHGHGSRGSKLVPVEANKTFTSTHTTTPTNTEAVSLVHSLLEIGGQSTPHNAKSSSSGLTSHGIESYSCRSTKYIPSAIEGYGPIALTAAAASPPISSPLRSSRSKISQEFKGSSTSLVVVDNQTPSSCEIKSLPTLTSLASMEQELCSSHPVDTIMCHISSRLEAASSYSLFGESVATESFRDSDFLTSVSLDHPTDLLTPGQKSPHYGMPPRSNTVSFRIPEEEFEVVDRLSTCSLPTLSRPALPSSSLSPSAAGNSGNGGDERRSPLREKAGHSFSHSDEVKKERHSKYNFDRSSLVVDPPRHAAFSLTQEMNSIRDERKDLESSLISCITERENLLQVLHYLQSLRKVMKHPPSAPSDGHSQHNRFQDQSSPSSTSIRKKFSTHNLTGRSRESSSELSSESISSHPDRNISQLSALLSAAVSNGLTVDPATAAVDSSSLNPTAPSSRLRGLSRDCIFREERLPSNVKEEKDPNVSEAEEFVYHLLSSSREGSKLSEGVGKVHNKVPHNKNNNYTSKNGNEHNNLKNNAKINSESNSEENTFLSLSLSQHIGPPPCLLAKEYERGRDLLETLWHRDMIIFETVEKLAQCLFLREQAWQRLRKLHSQESTLITTPEDLYDIDLLS